MKYILETAPGTDAFRTAAEEDGSPGCNFLLLRRKIGFLLKIEKEMVEYWTKDTKVFKEVQNMPAIEVEALRQMSVYTSNSQLAF